MGHYRSEVISDAEAEEIQRRHDVSRKISEIRSRLDGVSLSKIRLSDLRDLTEPLSWGDDNTELCDRLRALERRLKKKGA